MSLTVTLNVFSGRPNPVWTVPEGASEELNSRIAAITTTSNLKPAGVVAGLGYRGFSVRRNEESQPIYIHGGIVDPSPTSPTLIASDREIETWLLSTAGSQIGDDVKAHVQESLQSSISDELLLYKWPFPLAKCHPCVAADAPVYNPAIWNTAAVQPNNNCYNYANNRITNTFAQPGRATGHMYTQLNNCAAAGAVEPAAVSDGLHPVPNFAGHLAAGHGYYVALVLWPGTDFHWYRQDKVGCWSHKPGSTAARNIDNAGHAIADPKIANRGPYTVFCTYMVTNHRVHIN